MTGRLPIDLSAGTRLLALVGAVATVRIEHPLPVGARIELVAGPGAGSSVTGKVVDVRRDGTAWRIRLRLDSCRGETRQAIAAHLRAESNAPDAPPAPPGTR